ncbi:hypothetical protein Tco_0829358, partial [Tanacetum coccineum]
SSDVENSLVNDRFAKVEGINAVPPPMTGIYMPPRSDLGIDESIFIYGPKQSKTSESKTETNDFVSCESNSSVETLKSYESYNNDEYVTEPSKEQEKPSFAFANTVKHIKTPRETVEKQNTYSKNAKVDKRDWNDFDFHEKRMAKQVELNKKKGKGTGQGKNKTVWNNVQRLNHQNKFVPKAVLTKIGRFLVNTARQNFSSQAAATSTARKVNTAKPMVNDIRPRNNLYKSHSPIRRLFNKTTTPRTIFSYQKLILLGIKQLVLLGHRENCC